MKKTSVRVVPVTAEINGQRVVVGEAEIAIVDDGSDQTSIQLDLSTPEGLSMAEIISRGHLNVISVSSDKTELISQVAERNKQFKEENQNE